MLAFAFFFPHLCYCYCCLPWLMPFVLKKERKKATGRMRENIKKVLSSLLLLIHALFPMLLSLSLSLSVSYFRFSLKEMCRGGVKDFVSSIAPAGNSFLLQHILFFTRKIIPDYAPMLKKENFTLSLTHSLLIMGSIALYVD